MGRRTCSKAGGAAKRSSRLAPVTLMLVALVLTAGAVAARDNRPTPSGYPVPRWVSLKFGKVNARSGPADDYPTVWTYDAHRLPVQVIAETKEWRKICDPDGQTAWVHRRTVDGARTVFRASPQALAINARPDPKSPIRAYLSGRAMAELDTCDKGWCRIHVDNVRGWAPERELWGTGEAPRCR
jgi:SH3-like domain-containing protein